METWLVENGSTLVISLILAAIVISVIVHLIKQKKKGKSSCGCSCSDCPMHSDCHQNNAEE